MQNKVNFYDETDDIRFRMEHRIDWQTVFDLLPQEVRDTFGATSAEEYKAASLEALSSFGAICGTEVAPNAEQVEKEDLELKDGDVILPPTVAGNIQKLVEFGISAMIVPVEFGGMGTPFFVEASAHELVTRACPSTALNIVWYGSIAHIIDKFGKQELKEMTIPNIATGEWSGNMALTEADAGSDLGSMRSYGEKQPDGSYKLFGSKRFISNGASEVSLVLAKSSKDEEGLNALNLYLCLRHEDGKTNYTVTKIEEKLALHGSATCELQFDGSKAYLLGEENQGFRHMLLLMNDARIAVGFQGLGIMEGAFRTTVEYANQRETWGKPIAEHEMVAEKLLDMEIDIIAGRSLCYQAAWNQSVMYLIQEKLEDPNLSDDERMELQKRASRHNKRVRRWTPLIKWFVAEKAVELTRDCMQIHGGYGFTKEYRAEWYHREAMILPIYEGTSEIQALMCMKDSLKEIIRKPGGFIESALGHKVAALRESDPIKKKLYRAKQIGNGAIISVLLRLLRTNVRETISDVKYSDLIKMVRLLSRDLIKMENISPAMLHARRIVEIKALISLAESLVWDYEADASRSWVAERFLNRIIPRISMLKEEIEVDDPVLASRLGHDGETDLPQAAEAN